MQYLKFQGNSSSIVNKYHEGKLQSTLRRGLNAFEMVAIKATGTFTLIGTKCNHSLYSPRADWPQWENWNMRVHAIGCSDTTWRGAMLVNLVCGLYDQ